MIVTFNRQLCLYCEKPRLHECLDGLAKCVKCDSVNIHVNTQQEDRPYHSTVDYTMEFETARDLVMSR